MNNQYCSAHKTTPYNLVFGQYPRCDMDLVDILENGRQNEEPNSSFYDLHETDSESTFVTANSDSSNNDDNDLDSSTSQVYSITPQEIIDVSDSDSSQESMDTVISRRYTSQEKEKWQASPIEVIDESRRPLYYITNTTRPTFEQHESIQLSAILNNKKDREYIRSNIEKEYKTKRGRVFELGELVKIRVPDVDKLTMDQRSLPCKILQKQPNCDAYQVACQFGVLENWYSASELEPLGTSDYPALEVVPLNILISLREASFKQNNLRLSPFTRQATQRSQSIATVNNEFSNNINITSE
ncbi:21283_t:CDS:2 [Gigaspora margarita]|uniref:21283_t:CDS:1 n=1 Tax=Gigaspora margarita TaxID=4874 RepID=A0ABN7V221_GIGMA|nr:21283_t:CDS:2 [Gigaspora margarita]